MSSPEVSIIVPTRNEQGVLEHVLSDIRSQQHAPAFELIVADAHSTDRTRDIAREHGARVIDGGAAGAGRNAGAKEATTDTLLFLDADTRLHPGFLQRACAEFRFTGLDFATMDNRPMAARRRRLYRAMYRVHNSFCRWTVRVDPHLTSTCFLARRSAYDAIGGFDEAVEVFSDSELVKRAVRSGYRYGFLNSVEIHVSVRRFENHGTLRHSARVVGGMVRRRFVGEYADGRFYWGEP